jgi:hypothetical protein
MEMQSNMKKKPSKYPIPTAVKVGEEWYRVDRAEVIPGCRGVCNYEAKTINIAARSAGYAYTSSEQYNTFWHELTHAILKDMKHPQHTDEKFVSAFSDRLTSAVISAKF